MHQVLIDEPLPAHLQKLIDDSGQYELHTWEDTPEFKACVLPIAEAILIYSHFKVDEALLAQMPNLKVVVNSGRGTDHIKHEDAKARGIPVANLPHGILSPTVADMAFALILSSARRIIECQRHAVSPAFDHYDPNILLGHDVHGKTLGIVGMGSIGYEVARRGHRGFEMPVFYHNRRKNIKAEHDFGAVLISLETLFEQSDFIVLCLPLNDSTRNMIGDDELRRMKHDAFLINIGRGGTVDHESLFEILIGKHIAGAAFDVTFPEPLPRHDPLLKLDNFLVLPHLGSGTIENRNRMADIAFANLEAGFGKCEFRNRVV